MGTTGRCLCGQITFTAKGPLRPVLHCHCENCRRATGNFVAASGCATADLAIHDSDALLRWHELEHCRYGFCSGCGSHMFWQGNAHRDRTSIQVGVLDDATGLALAGVWFVDEAQAHHCLDGTVPHHQGNGDQPV